LFFFFFSLTKNKFDLLRYNWLVMSSRILWFLDFNFNFQYLPRYKVYLWVRVSIWTWIWDFLDNLSTLLWVSGSLYLWGSYRLVLESGFEIRLQPFCFCCLDLFLYISSSCFSLCLVSSQFCFLFFHYCLVLC